MKDRGVRAFALIALVFAMLAAACSSGGSDGGSTSGPAGSSGKPSGTLRLFSYSDGFDPAYMASFYKEYPDIDLETASFGSNDEAIAKLQAGFQADVHQQLRRRGHARHGEQRAVRATRCLSSHALG